MERVRAKPIYAAHPRRFEAGHASNGASWTRRNLATQGYRFSAQQQHELRVGVRFPTAVCLVLVAAGLALQSPLTLALVAVIATVAGFAPRHPFDLVWNRGVRHLVGAPPLPPNPVRRRHGFRVGAVWLLAVAGLFWAQLPVAALVLGGLMVPLCALVTVANFCAASELLAWWERRSGRAEGASVLRSSPFAAITLTVAATLASLIAAPTAPASPGGSNSAATITGSFGELCRDFAAHSSKDISHVEVRYADGRVVKDETIANLDYSIDGGAGQEIDIAIVKSGTTRERFRCAGVNSPPTAVLEVKAPEGCFTWDDGLVDCSGQVPRTAWSRSTIPDLGYGIVRFFCGWPDDPSCVDHVMPCGQRDFYSLCQVVYTFRGTSSSDPDDNIVSWTIDFGDGTSVSGDWVTNPPTEVSHEYLIHHCPTCSRDPATLTVTDFAGQTDTDAQLADHQYPE